jgi:hypothetical protein
MNHATPKPPVALSQDELRELASFAAQCAERVLPIFEQATPGDQRPRQAIVAAHDFARSGQRSNTLRASGLAAFKAVKSAGSPAAAQAAQAATQAVGAAYLHPFADARQVIHILGSAAYAAHAAELHNPSQQAGQTALDWAIHNAPPAIAQLLRRYPDAPMIKGRFGEFLQSIDKTLRQ